MYEETISTRVCMCMFHFESQHSRLVDPTLVNNSLYSQDTNSNSNSHPPPFGHYTECAIMNESPSFNSDAMVEGLKPTIYTFKMCEKFNNKGLTLSYPKFFEKYYPTNLSLI